jgi:hypothetical protein
MAPAKSAATPGTPQSTALIPLVVAPIWATSR